MSAAVETMAYLGATPWHGLGTVLSESDATSVEKTIIAAGLNWTVDKVPLQTSDTAQLVNGLFGHRRSTDGRMLGFGTDRYQILQNIECFEWFQPFLDLGAVNFNTAGALHDGEVIWVMAKLQGLLQVAPDDEIEKYLLLSHSHNGKLAISVLETPVRVVCQNTLAIAQKSKETKTWAKVKHSKGMHASLSSVRDAIAESNLRFQEYVTLYRKLAAVQCRPAQAQEYFLKFMGKEGANPADLPTRSKNRLERLVELMETGKGNTNPAIKNTWWTAYNAVTEFLSYENGRNAENRYHSLWYGNDNTTALQSALEMAA